MLTILGLLLAFIIFFASGFCVFYFGSKLTDHPLETKEAVMSALALGIVAIATSFLSFYGIVLTIFLLASLLTKVYDCGILSSIFMSFLAYLLPGLIGILLR